MYVLNSLGILNFYIWNYIGFFVDTLLVYSPFPIMLFLNLFVCLENYVHGYMPAIAIATYLRGGTCTLQLRVQVLQATYRKYLEIPLEGRHRREQLQATRHTRGKTLENIIYT